MADQFTRKRLPDGKGVDIFKNGRKVGHAATDGIATKKIQAMKNAVKKKTKVKGKTRRR